jgi:coenzyme F420 biosynthesis associated uncharacterized protein
MRNSFILGTAFGAAAGAGWVLAQRLGRGRENQLLDWNQITSVALRLGAQAPPIDPTTRREIESTYTEILHEVAEPLAAYTGTGLLLADTPVSVMDRAEWVRANVANFRHLFEPLERSWAENNAREGNLNAGSAAISRSALSAEMGLLLGYLARRVLGQYDITLLSAEPEPGKLYFVEPNIQSVQLKLGLPRREFRVWLTLHEATHAHEFEGHPWIRTYMDGLLQEYLQSMVAEVLKGQLASVAGLTGAVDRLIKGESLIEAAMTPAQYALFEKLQALMTLLEGYATHLMTAVGQHLIPHYQEIEDRVEARQHQRSWPEILFLRLTGLQLKFEQYRLGTAFVAQVERERGAAFLHRVWEGPDQLPTLEEIREPQLWINRVEAIAA